MKCEGRSCRPCRVGSLRGRRTASRAGRDHDRVGDLGGARRRRGGRGRPASQPGRRGRLLRRDRERRARAPNARSSSSSASACTRPSRDEPQRRVFTFVDSDGERTITLMGEKLRPHGADPLPWNELAAIDAVYFSAGRPGRASRRAAGTCSRGDGAGAADVARGQVQLDALVLSARDPSEAYEPGQLDPAPGLIVSTRGPGGRHIRRGRALRLVSRRRASGPDRERVRRRRLVRGRARVCACARRRDRESARLRRRCGAAAMTGRGAYEGQLSLAEDC